LGDTIIKRYEELDSLRGLAALMVLFSHFITVRPTFGRPIMYSQYGTLINVLWNGQSAVIMFFIVRGLVLSLPLYKDGEFKYSKYWI
jgi:peptidoglycan/LPS O-acetylase OafA/YrhL